MMDEQGRTFIHFHQKFAHTVEDFVVRTHQTFSNEDGWLVTAPFEFNGETIADSYDKEDVVGRYEFIYHRTEFQSTTPPHYDYVESQGLTLNEDGTVSGAYEGTWTLKGHYITIAINNQEYKGVVLEQYEQTNARDKVMVFTAIGSDNRTIWGSKTHKTDEEAVEYDAAQLTVPETAAEDFDLPTEGLFGSTVTWTSDNKALAVENGTAKLGPGVKEEKATLTAVVTRGGSSKTLTFTVAVEPISLLISPVVKGTSIELPAKIGEYDIAWSSSDASVINPETGAVTPPAAKAAVVTLTAKFSSEERTFDVTVLPLEVSSYIMRQDYNSVTDAASVWTSDNAQDKVVLASDEAHGKYIQFTPERNNSRGAVTDFGVSDKLSGGIYTVEFDVSLKAGDNQTTEFALTGTDMAYSNNIINDGIDSGYIFKMSSEVNSTKWSINGADAVDIPADWVHVLAAVDPSKKAASIVISKDDTIYFNEAVAINGNGVLKGMYVRGGRYDSVTKVDNIQVY